jgi:hypothetical protein
MEKIAVQYALTLLRVHGECGAGEMNRTPDLRITNALLYQLSYTGVFRRARTDAEGRWLRSKPQPSP